MLNTLTTLGQNFTFRITEAANLSVTISSGTVVLERQRPSDGTWKLVETYTEDMEDIVYNGSKSAMFRFRMTVVGSAEIEIW